MEYQQVKTPKKLIEVAMPLEVINIESLRRKQKAPKGWPTSFHKWWAQRPLAAARAVLFCQLVNDPSWKWEMEHPGELPLSSLRASWAASRRRLFALLEELVLWDNSNNEDLLQRAHQEIQKSWHDTCELNQTHPNASELFNPDKLPSFCDPFAGSGTIPLEAQRLGLKAFASDLNPVAVLINKALIELPSTFANCAPVNRDTGQNTLLRPKWRRAEGLAADVRYYGKWMRDEATRRIGHLYPAVEITSDLAAQRLDLKPFIGQTLTTVAWLWARTVKSPNPAFRNVDVPLVSTFMLSNKSGKESFVEPVITNGNYRFSVKVGTPPDIATAKSGSKLGSGGNFRCIMSGAGIEAKYIRTEAQAGRMGSRLMAVVADGPRGRVFLSPQPEMEELARSASPSWRPDLKVPTPCHDVDRLPMYGMPTWGDAFTPRQALALTTFCELVKEVRERVRQDALYSGMSDSGDGLAAGGIGATAYAEAISVYLACVLDRMVYYGSSLTTWLPKDNALRDCMPRQAIAMAWDYAEANPLGKSSGDISTCISSVCNFLDVAAPRVPAVVSQADVRSKEHDGTKLLFSTDPPYFDNVSYADLSDYFYVWLRPSLRSVYPDLFATVAVPKAEELVATPYRHGSKKKAEAFFLSGMTDAMHRLAEQAHPAFPVTIYYAFKQRENQADVSTANNGWETFLDAVLRAGFAITGTWPMRTEGAGRMVANETNALASSIVLVCRPRPAGAPATSRRAFLREINMVLPQALDEMTRGSGDERSPVAPVDLSQAVIGPGMAVFSKYSSVLEADGTPMTVKTALQLINRFLAEDDFDRDTQFCLRWFEQHGWTDGPFGTADMLARAKGTSVDGVKQAGVLYATGGIVRLLKWAQYPADWDPHNDTRLPVWEALHHLIRVFKTDGESGAGAMLAAVQSKSEAIRQLAYRLYTLCERAGSAEDARAYNEIITSWAEIESAAARVPAPQQTTLFA